MYYRISGIPVCFAFSSVTFSIFYIWDLVNVFLYLFQLEDQAIEDLLAFYNAAGATEERITVKRVISGTVAPPKWITSHH
jgi:hypothetical protein